MTWNLAHYLCTLNWEDRWHLIAAGTTGEQPPRTLELLAQLDRADRDKDYSAFLRLVAELVSLPSWHGSRPGSLGNPAVASAKPTAPPIQQGFLT